MTDFLLFVVAVIWLVMTYCLVSGLIRTEFRFRNTVDHLANTDDRIRSLARRVDLSERELMEINRVIREERMREEVSE